MRLLVAGEGAIARKHLAAFARIPDVEVAMLVGGDAGATEQLAREVGIGDWSLALDDGLARSDVDAVLLATPTPLHAQQAIRSLEAGKHTLVEIPVADSLADAEAVVAAAERSGPVAMVCHTRRFNASHRWVHRQIRDGDLQLQHLVVQTYFMRRDNRNAMGQPRTWVDHLLWHHACHTVDLFLHQTGDRVDSVWAHQGPRHPELGIAMDMSIGLSTASGILCTLALSFNNDGPLGTTFRYIGDTGTYVASYDDLVTGAGVEVDVSSAAVASDGEVAADGYELQGREFLAAVRQRHEPDASVHRVLPTMRLLERIRQHLGDSS